MTKSELFVTLLREFKRIVNEHNLEESEISIKSASLSPEEAIGITSRKDYPILDGKEIMLQAEWQGSIGQAFTSSPADFSGTLKEILESDIQNDSQARALFIATMNAVMRHLNLCDSTVHCKNEGPELCAKQYVPFIKEHYGNPKIALIGYQPALLENLAANFEVRILDLNPVNVGHERFGVMVEHGIDDCSAVKEWADLILCTGSTLANASIVDYMDLNKDVIFFGTTLAGAAEILGLKRKCFEAK